MRWLRIALLTLVAWPNLASARVERFALIIGNDVGAAGEIPLRYAETDAQHVYDVLNELGDFSALNMQLLRGQDAATVRGALLALNERIRATLGAPDTEAVLVIYYSGHADGLNLHLRGSELPLSELRQFASGSAANFRLVILDACRSGALTRVKGGARTTPFALPSMQPKAALSDGLVFLTASSANEDAQESDELRGAFFTHALVSGLHGAADSNRDGAVSLDEVYRYAYEATLRVTSRTWAGTQHPTFHYDLRGRGELVLTRTQARAADRSHFDFPSGVGFLLMRESADGPVVLELEREARSRVLSLPPGRYFVRGRGPDIMYEGYVDAAAGTSRSIDLAQLERIEYAQLVRKGGASPDYAHGIEAGMSMRSALPNAAAACLGGFIGYAVDWSGLGARVRFGTCASQLQNRLVSAAVLASDVAGQLYRAWDLSSFSVELGMGAGLGLFSQQFETRGAAPGRLSAAPFVSLNAGTQANLPHGLFASLNLGAETHFLRLSEPAADSSRLSVAFALRASVGLGKRF